MTELESKMKKENYIASLFKKAKQEEPQLTYEEAAENFSISANLKIELSLKEKFFKNIYFNSFLIGLGIFMIFGLLHQSTQGKTKLISSESSTINSNHEHIEQSTSIALENSEITENITSSQPKVISANEKVKHQEVTKISATNTKHHNEIIQHTNSERQTIPMNKPIESNKTNQEPQLTQEYTSRKKSITTIQKKEAQHYREELLIERKPKIENRSELEIILETVLNANQLKKEVFIKNNGNEFQQLIINTNGKFDNMIEVLFAGKKAIIIKSQYSGSFNLLNEEYVNIEDIKLDETKASLEFSYNLEYMTAELEKINDIWFLKSILKSFKQEDHTDRQNILQVAFADKKMNDIIRQGTNGSTKPIALLTNGNISDKVNIQYENKSLEIINHTSSFLYSRRNRYVSITDFKVKKKRAILSISYKNKSYELTFRKKDDRWNINTFKLE